MCITMRWSFPTGDRAAHPPLRRPARDRAAVAGFSASRERSGITRRALEDQGHRSFVSARRPASVTRIPGKLTELAETGLPGWGGRTRRLDRLNFMFFRDAL